ncbi:MAG: aspartate aminotransferase family protein [Vicinamibacterales bacterium]
MPDLDVLSTAAALAAEYLASVPSRRVTGVGTRRTLLTSLGGPLPEAGDEPASVIRGLAREADSGIVATAGPRYFGFVTGGAVPVTVAAEWLASAWDQNGALYVMSPAVAVLEDIVAAWILEMLRLPAGASVGFVTGAHMANFTCLAAARHEVLRRAGWDVEEQGLQRAPRVTVLVGDEVHVSVVGALRMLGFGAGELVRVASDNQGRMRLEAATAAIARVEGPFIVCTQVGNVSSGASDPVRAIIDLVRPRHGWTHVDGAFGLWASAVRELRAQVAGVAEADSWTTDAHKWLNVPYDSGLAVVAHPAPHRAAMSLHASYLVRGADEERVGMDWVPESSRRARVIPLYALFRALGRTGIEDMIRRTVALAQRMAVTLARCDGIRILNAVDLNQVLVRFEADGRDGDRLTRDVIGRVQAEGTCWAGGSVWKGQHVMRVSVSNWSTTEADIDQSAGAIIRCYDAARAGHA